MAITIKHVADSAGLSYQTVADVLNAQGPRRNRYRPETQQRVLHAASQLGYRLNRAARSVSTGRFNAISLLLSTVNAHSAVPPRLFNGILDSLARVNYSLNVLKLPDSSLTDPALLLRILCEVNSDGLLIDYTHGAPEMFAATVDRLRIPAIWLNTKRDHDCVYPDEVAAGRRAVEILRELGHQRIVFVNYSYETAKAHFSAVDRMRGYQQAMTSDGLPAVIYDRYTDGVDDLERAELWRRRLRAPDRPTAIIGYAESSLFNALRAAEAVGLRIPADLSILTFGNAPWRVGQDVATLVLPEPGMAEEAVAMLVAKVAQPALRQAARVLQFDFTPGATLHPVQ